MTNSICLIGEDNPEAIHDEIMKEFKDELFKKIQMDFASFEFPINGLIENEIRVRIDTAEKVKEHIIGKLKAHLEITEEGEQR
jgi:hypothetical protein